MHTHMHTHTHIYIYIYILFIDLYITYILGNTGGVTNGYHGLFRFGLKARELIDGKRGLTG